MNFCCIKIHNEIAEWSEIGTKNHSIVYDRCWREYFILYTDHRMYRDDRPMTYIYNCPFCGTKLPESLADKWFDVLEEEYGITDPHDKEYDKVPAEFRTDEWWKKRGL